MRQQPAGETGDGARQYECEGGQPVDGDAGPVGRGWIAADHGDVPAKGVRRRTKAKTRKQTIAIQA